MIKIRVKFLIISILSLLIGFLIYCFFKSNTVVNRVLELLGLTLNKIELKNTVVNNIFLFYLSDYLWLLSLQFAVLSISDSKKIFVLISLTFFFACIFEIVQYLGIISGTGDIFDILAYFMASVSTYIIIKFERVK